MSFRSPQSQKKRCKRGRWSLSSVRLQLLSQWAPSRQQQSATRWHIHDTRKSRITRKRGRSSSPNHHLRYLTTNSVKEAKQTTGETQDHISSVRPISFFFFLQIFKEPKIRTFNYFWKNVPICTALRVTKMKLLYSCVTFRRQRRRSTPGRWSLLLTPAATLPTPLWPARTVEEQQRAKACLWNSLSSNWVRRSTGSTIPPSCTAGLWSTMTHRRHS